jgi:predicted Zn-dependent peptidase
MDNSQFQKTTLPNGLRVLTERHPDVVSATIGVWILAGSVYERDNERGLAHLLEHMVFKGTERRTMHQIAAAMDSIGGQTNAFTEREYVCYHAKVLAEHTPLAMELLCDLVARPVLKPDDLELERGVVLEEIKSVEDAPEELVEDLFTETIWPRSRWGRSILGTPRSVSNLKVEDLRRFMDTHYTPHNVLVAAVGDVQHEAIVRRSEKLLCDLPPGTKNNAHRVPAEPKVQAHQVQWSRDTEQVHLCCGTRSYPYDDPDRFAAWLLDTVLTGGYSSRLFQEIREKRGLCYNIGPLSACYRKAGFWAIETSVAPPMAARVVDLIGRELRRVKAKGILRSEWKRARQMSRVNLLLAEESSSTQMSRIARNELYYGRQKSTAEVLNDVLSVTLEDIQRVANEMFDSHLMNLAAIGPFDDGAQPLQVDVG